MIIAEIGSVHDGSFGNAGSQAGLPAYTRTLHNMRKNDNE
jgi:hypothetical protein